MTKRRGLLLAVASLILPVLLASCSATNRAPIAMFTRSPASGDVPLSVYFDAADSFDTDGTIATYSWDFGDGIEATESSASHTYDRSGTFEATLTVTDDRGARGEAIRAVVVSDPVSPPETGASIGQAAPDFELPTLDGVATSLTQYRGYVVLLDFWRSSCPPCRLTMPHLESLRQRFAEDGLVVVTVNLDTTEEEARSYLNESGLNEFVVLRGSLDDATAVRNLYGVDAIPRTFVLDRQGIIRHTDHPIRLRDYHIEPWL